MYINLYWDCYWEIFYCGKKLPFFETDCLKRRIGLCWHNWINKGRGKISVFLVTSCYLKMVLYVFPGVHSFIMASSAWKITLPSRAWFPFNAVSHLMSFPIWCHFPFDVISHLMTFPIWRHFKQNLPIQRHPLCHHLASLVSHWPPKMLKV